MENLLIPTDIQDIFRYEIPEDKEEQRNLIRVLENVKKEFEKRVFYIQGKILFFNHENEVWKEDYGSFEEFVRKEFKFSRQYAYSLMNSYEFTENHREDLVPIIDSLSEPFVRTILKASNSKDETDFQKEVVEKIVQKSEENAVFDEVTGESIQEEIKPALVKTICDQVRVNRQVKAGQFDNLPNYGIGDIVLVEIKSNVEPEVKRLLNNKLAYVYKHGNITRKDETGGTQCYFLKTWDGQNSVTNKDDCEIDLIVQFYDIQECDSTITENFTLCSDLYKEMLLMSLNKDRDDRIMPKDKVLETLIEKGLKYDELLEKYQQLEEDLNTNASSIN